MALAELLAVGAQNHGEVGEGGNLVAEGLEHEHLARGVGEVVVAADDVGHAHLAVVDDGGEVVGGRAVGAHEDHVVKLLGVEHARAVHDVVHHDVAAVLGNLEAPHVGLAGVDAALGLGRVDVAAGALIALERVATLMGGVAGGLELLGRAEARIGVARVDELLERLLIVLLALRLIVGAKVAAYLGALVPVEAEPLEGAQDLVGVLLGGALRVGVVDAKDEGAAVGAGEGPVVNGHAGAADVQAAGGGGCEAHSNLVGQGMLQSYRPYRAIQTWQVYGSNCGLTAGLSISIESIRCVCDSILKL